MGLKKELEVEVERWITENLKDFVIVVGYASDDSGVVNISLDPKFKAALSAHISGWLKGRGETDD
jgi:hypothetical protein